VNLDTKLFNKFDLPECFTNRCSVLRNFMRNDTTSYLFLLKYMYVIVSHSSQECSAAERSRSSSNNCDGFFVRRWEYLWQRWIPNLGDTHLFENSNGELLQSVNLDSTLLSMAYIAVSCTKLTNGAELTTGKAKRVI
jgi:hypothetical protein